MSIDIDNANRTDQLTSIDPKIAEFPVHHSHESPKRKGASGKSKRHVLMNNILLAHQNDQNRHTKTSKCCTTQQSPNLLNVELECIHLRAQTGQDNLEKKAGSLCLERLIIDEGNELRRQIRLHNPRADVRQRQNLLFDKIISVAKSSPRTTRRTEHTSTAQGTRALSSRHSRRLASTM